MTEEEIKSIFTQCNAILTNGHYVYTSGRHGSTYINKDAIYQYPLKLSLLCLTLAEKFYYLPVEAVVAPAIGGVALTQWTAYHLSQLTNRTILAAYAEKKQTELVIKRGYAKLLYKKKVLVVDDVFNTGNSVQKTIAAVESIEGKPIGVAVLCDRSNMITSRRIPNIPFFSLLEIPADSWKKEMCPLCLQRIPINREIGKETF